MEERKEQNKLEGGKGTKIGRNESVQAIIRFKTMTHDNQEENNEKNKSEINCKKIKYLALTLNPAISKKDSICRGSADPPETITFRRPPRFCLHTAKQKKINK